MIVVDNTVLADWAFGIADHRLHAEALLEAEPEWITVGLFRYELGNVAWKTLRFGEGWDGNRIEKAMKNASVILTEIVSELRWNEVLEIALEKEISFYDAAYVWLAKKRDLTLYSRDARLVAKCPDVARPMPNG